MDELSKSSAISTFGMKAQATRLRVISENLANTDSVSETAGGNPYRRKLVSFRNELDRQLGADIVRIKKIEQDTSDFGKRYEPGNPRSDGSGYLLLPNVDPLIELMDMKEAQRTYEANLNVVQTSRALTARTIELLK